MKLTEKLLEFKNKGYEVAKILPIITDGFLFNRELEDMIDYNFENIEYPENLLERIETPDIDTEYDDEQDFYKEIKWNGYKWLVLIHERTEDDWGVKVHYQAYKDIENLTLLKSSN